MNKKILTIIFFLAIIALVFGAFLIFKYFQEEEREPIFKPEPEEIKDIVLANNQFAIDLYAKAKNREKNIFFSPYSLSVALAMTYEGAKGETAQEMENVFNFPKDNQFRRNSYFILQNWLLGKNTEHELNLANAIWPQKDFLFLKEYFDIISEHYQGLIENVDFAAKPEQSREKINKWVEIETKDNTSRQY